MILSLPSGQAHLTYCMNIHRGETWDEVKDALLSHLPAVKRSISPEAPMGVGLRLSAIAAEQAVLPEETAWLVDFCAKGSFYVFTINGFPFGPFHGTRVKEQVYEPDWRRPERLAYTNRLADLLARLLPPGMAGTISTVPGAFRTARGEGETAIAEALLRHAAHLASIEDRCGRRIALALEPEPMCLMETTAEAVEFFETYLFAAGARSRFAALTGRAEATIEALLRRHLTVCLDVCHSAVEFEQPADSLALLRRAGLEVGKLQLSSALSVRPVDASIIPVLKEFDDGVYLHQVVESGPAGLVRHLDLPDAFASLASSPADEREWRVHCHVPVFHAASGRLGTTQPALIEFLRHQRDSFISAHLEVETYTWDVLPPELREGDIDAAIARELHWVRDQLRP